MHVLLFPKMTLLGKNHLYRASQVALVARNPPAKAGDVRDASAIPGSGGAPGKGHGSSLQYSCLENSRDRRAWRATVHRAAKSQTRLSDLARVHRQRRLWTGRALPSVIEQVA